MKCPYLGSGKISGLRDDRGAEDIHDWAPDQAGIKKAVNQHDGGRAIGHQSFSPTRATERMLIESMARGRMLPIRGL